jgi:ketosteroid isomerase-like protein
MPRLSLAAVVLLCAACTSLPPQEVATGDARDAFQAYVDAFNARQWNRVVALYSDDAGFRWTENGKVVYASKADVEHAYAWLREHASSARYLPSDTNVTGLSRDAAQVATRFTTRVETVDGRRFVYSGEMRIELKREGKAWKIAGGEARVTGAVPPH